MICGPTKSPMRMLRPSAGQKIYFASNHPIRYVRLVGIVVTLVDLNQWISVVTVDDSSGAVIDVVIKRLTSDIAKSIDCPSNTEVSNVNISSGFGPFGVLVDGVELDVGMCVKVKGTITEFRDTKQVDLKRISLVHTTAEEVACWVETADFKRAVLSKHWVLSDVERTAVEDGLEKESRREKKREKLKKEHELRKKVKVKEYEQKMRVYEDKLEKRRMKEEAKLNEGALI